MGIRDSIKKIFSSREQDDRVSLSRKVQMSPNDPQARQKLGIFLMHQGEVVEGLDQLARSAVLYEKDGFAGKAIAVLRQMQKHDPGNNDFQKWLVRLLAQEGLSADAQAELRKVAADPSRFTSEEQRLDFFRQTAEFMKKNPLPLLYVCDILRGQKKLHEAVNELQKAAGLTVSSGMYAEFTERLRAIISSAANDPAILEPCGFLWLAIGRQEEGLPLLDRVAEGMSGDPERAAAAHEVLDAVRDGSSAVVGSLSFHEASNALAESGKEPEKEPPPPPQPAPVPPEAAPADETAPQAAEEEEGYEREESIVRDALGRLQAKVDEEIGEKDLEARYNLGIAYKEMGLHDEAVIEFRLAMRDPGLLVGAGSLLADTLADRSDVDGAVAVLDEILASSRGEAVSRDVRYHKAVLLENSGRRDEAQTIFRELNEENPGYRDVRNRIADPPR